MMTIRYSYTREDSLSGMELSLSVNNHIQGPSAHALYVSLGNNSTAVMGKDEIEKFIYAAAVNGGLIEKGEELRLAQKRELPEDGLYVLDSFSDKCIAQVVDGRLLVPQIGDDNLPDGTLVERTNSYLRPGNTWKLTPLKETDK